jgi:Tol biopolymer transport system component
VIAQAHPYWSPGNVLGQGEKVVFSYPPDALFVDPFADLDSMERDLFVMDPDGSGLTRLTDTPDVPEVVVAWSPDGTRLAVTVHIVEAYPDWVQHLYIYDLSVVDGKLKATPTRNIHEEASLKGINLPVGILEIAWANRSNPDVLVIVSRANPISTVNDEIFLLDLNTFETRTLITSAQLPGGPLTSPSFSPDGSKLAFTLRSDKRTLGGIFSINSDGTGLKKLATATMTLGVDWAK